MLVGCSHTPKKPDAQALIDQQIIDASEQIQAAQTELYLAGAINKETVKRSASILDLESKITVSWQGDALQLLNKLAHDQQLNFVFVGQRMPLPVNIVIKDRPYSEVIDMLRAQIGYRAIIEQRPDRLTLHYNPPMGD